jgi:hypothetical protein
MYLVEEGKQRCLNTPGDQKNCRRGEGISVFFLCSHLSLLTCSGEAIGFLVLVDEKFMCCTGLISNFCTLKYFFLENSTGLCRNNPVKKSV